jgi:hypothetical protein
MVWQVCYLLLEAALKPYNLFFLSFHFYSLRQLLLKANLLQENALLCLLPMLSMGSCQE